MSHGSPFSSPEIKNWTCGPRPSVSKLLDLVDTADPAFQCIVDVLKDMQQGGIELNESTVAMAVTLGRQKRERSRGRGRTALAASALPEAIVYYIRRGRFIKIGTTTAPARRFHALLPDEILAFEPGGTEEEFARHMQFLHLRVGARGEHFEPGEDLLAHIAAVRQQYGEPDPTWSTTENLSERVNPYLTEIPEPTTEETATVAEGSRILGLKQFTVYGWVRRGRLIPTGTNDQGRRLFSLDQMAFLANLNRRWSDAS